MDFDNVFPWAEFIQQPPQSMLNIYVRCVFTSDCAMHLQALLSYTHLKEKKERTVGLCGRLHNHAYMCVCGFLSFLGKDQDVRFKCSFLEYTQSQKQFASQVAAHSCKREVKDY